MTMDVRDPNQSIAKEDAVDRASDASIKPLSVTKETLPSRVPATRLALGLSVEVVTTAEQLSALRSDYERVLLSSNNKLPFALHEWHVVWCDHFLESRLQLQTQPRFYVIRDAENCCVAIVPLILTRRALGPIKISSLDLVGADPGLTEIRGAIIQPGFEARVASLMQREVATLRSVDWVRWNNINGVFGDALADAGNLTWEKPVLDYILDLPPTWEVLRAKLKRNIRESIRHSYNALKRDGIDFEFRVAETAADVHAGLDRFFALHEMRANLQGTVSHRNAFSSERLRSFFRDICSRFAPLGAVRLFQLVIGGEVVAARAAFIVQDSMYLYFSGFDPKWADYAVMTTTLVESVKYALNHQMKTINFSIGHDLSKSRWGVREIQLACAVAVRPSRLSKLAWTGFHLASQDGAKPTLLSKLLRPAARHWG
jgi:CelD/BcsL family acetyltransferase involved in cellulose biosynthesis